jgi:hypothetical protein
MVFKTKLSSVLHFSNINLPCISLESLSRCHLVYQMAILVVFSSKETESLCSFFRPVQHSLWILPNSFLWRPKMITKTSLSIWHTFHSYWCPVSDTPDYSLSSWSQFWLPYSTLSYTTPNDHSSGLFNSTFPVYHKLPTSISQMDILLIA